jgi:hypothetical protein
MWEGRCAECHAPPSFMDQQLHDLEVECFYQPALINGQQIHWEGPIKTFTLRGIKDSPRPNRCGFVQSDVGSTTAPWLILKMAGETEAG